MVSAVTPLAQPSDATAFGSLPEVYRNNPDQTYTALLARATRAIESRCDRRLAPFTGLVETTRAEGVDPDSAAGSGWPLSLQGSLGLSKANALGATALCRDLWLREYAPIYPDMWAGSIQSITLTLAYGGTQTLPAGEMAGPDPDTGHVRLNLGTFCPPGTTIAVTYSGGYDPVPDDLVQACLLQAMKLALIGAEPQTRSGLSYAELDAELVGLLDPYMRR